MQKSIGVLDDSVARGTELRQEQHADFVTLQAKSAAATGLLEVAVSRVNKFYAPTLQKAAPKAGLSADNRVDVNVDGEITTAAPAGIAGTSVARVQLLQSDPVSEPFYLEAGEKPRRAKECHLAYRVFDRGSDQGVAGCQGGRGPLPA